VAPDFLTKAMRKTWWTTESYNMKNYEDELKAQQDFVFLYRAAHLFAGLLFLATFLSGNYVFGGIAFSIQAVVHALLWPRYSNELEQRRRVVAFKQETGCIYVFTQAADDVDKTVAATFNDVLKTLKEVGNTHEVRVYMAIYGDVSYFVSWFDAEGKRYNEQHPRPDGSSYQTWDEYCRWCEDFRNAETEKRLRQLRENKKGATWVNEVIFQQHGHN
jgi:hypothetical protein